MRDEDLAEALLALGIFIAVGDAVAIAWFIWRELGRLAPTPLDEPLNRAEVLCAVIDAALVALSVFVVLALTGQLWVCQAILPSTILPVAPPPVIVLGTLSIGVLAMLLALRMRGPRLPIGVFGSILRAIGLTTIALFLLGFGLGSFAGPGGSLRGCLIGATAGLIAGMIGSWLARLGRRFEPEP